MIRRGGVAALAVTVSVLALGACSGPQASAAHHGRSHRSAGQGLRLRAVGVPALPPGQVVTSVAADGPATAWALSQTNEEDAAGMPVGGAELLRFDHAWSAVALRDKEWRLTALASGGSASVWGIGYVISAGRSSFAPLLVHWNGSSWRQILLPQNLQAARTEVTEGPGLIAMLSIRAASGNRVWLEDDAQQPRRVLLYYDGAWHLRVPVGPGAIWLANLAQRSRGPWVAVPAGNDGVRQIVYAPRGSVWAYGDQADVRPSGGRNVNVLFRLWRGRLVPVSVPAELGQKLAEQLPDPVLAVDTAGDPVLVAEPWLADRLLYATYDADQGASPWQLQDGPSHPGAEEITAAAASAFPGSDAFLVIGAERMQAGGVAVADAADLAGAIPAPALAVPPIPLPSHLEPGWHPTALPRSVSPPAMLTSVSASGAGDALAGGAEDIGIFGADRFVSPAGAPLILHWNGRAWSRQRVDVSFFGSVTGLAAGLHGTGWAIAEDSLGRYHLLTLSTGVWRETAFPGQARPGLALTSIAAAPDGTAWVAGDMAPRDTGGLRLQVQAPLILHWTSGAWQRVPPPADDWWPVQIAAAPSGIWLAAQATDQVYPLYWDVALARPTGDGWQSDRASTAATRIDAEFLSTGGTLGMAVTADGNVWVAAAQPPFFHGPPPTDGPPPPSVPPMLLRWSQGAWTVITSRVTFVDVVPGQAGPVLITPQPRPVHSDLFSTVPVPMAGFTASNQGDLPQQIGQPGQIASVPGTSELWAVTGNWIARYP